MIWKYKVAKSAIVGGIWSNSCAVMSPLWIRNKMERNETHENRGKKEFRFVGTSSHPSSDDRSISILSPSTRFPLIQMPARVVWCGDWVLGTSTDLLHHGILIANVPIAATVEAPDSVLVHHTSPISKPNPAHAACRYALTRSGSIVKGDATLVGFKNIRSRTPGRLTVRVVPSFPNFQEQHKKYAPVVSDAQTRGIKS
jgi:hypothetical protein